jgi:hypothetical protein
MAMTAREGGRREEEVAAGTVGSRRSSDEALLCHGGCSSLSGGGRMCEQQKLSILGTRNTRAFYRWTPCIVLFTFF